MRPRTSPPRVAAAVALLVAVAGLLTGCSDDPSDPTPSTQEDAMYCDLIDPETIAPIVGDEDVKAFGGPKPLNPLRLVQCTIYAEDRRPDGIVLTIESIEHREPDARADAEARLDSARASAETSDSFTAIETDKGSGFAFVDGTDAVARLVTADRSIYATAPTSEADAAFVPTLADLVQEFDVNLDAWDAENPS